MSEQRIHIPTENPNLAGAEEDVQPPSNNQVGGVVNPDPKLQEAMLSAELERRKLFRSAFRLTMTAIASLYGFLIFWILTQTASNQIHDNVWHIALILVIPPTTLLFLLIKVLAKQDNHSPQNTPIEELVSQLIGLAKSVFEKK